MDLFVYGTLREPSVAASILETFEYGPEAVLEGLSCVAGRYPTLTPGGRTRGRLLRTDAIEAVDRYEGVDRGLYIRVRVPRADGGWVETYVGDPDRLEVTDRWPHSGSLADRVAWYIREHGVSVRIDPGPDRR